MFEFRAFGRVNVCAPDGTGVDHLLAQPKRLALFAYLAIARPRGFHRRDKLVALFWPDADAAHARASLRKSLHILRGMLGADLVITRGNEEIGLDFSNLRCDVAAFQDAVEGGRSDEALALYRGDLLDGVFAQEGPFEQWLEQERAWHRSAAARAASQEQSRSVAARDLVTAVELGRRAMELDPREATLRQLIDLLDQLGDRRGALEAYESFADCLATEFDSEPAAETRGVMEQVRARSTSVVSSIAVLPLRDASADGSGAHIAEGFTEKLIADLSAHRGLRVIARASANRFAAEGGTLRTVARELGVRYAVEGSVQEAGGQLRVTGRLVAASSGSELWADTLTAPVDCIFDLHRSLADTVIRQLPSSTGVAVSPATVNAPIPNLRAYDCYLRARMRMWRYDWDELRTAISLLEQAIDLVGDNALLLAALGRVHVTLVYSGASADPRNLELAGEYASKGLQLDPRCAPLYVLRGLLSRMAGKPLQAVPSLKAALALDPHDPDALCWLGYVYALAGRPAKASLLADELLWIDPLSGIGYALAGFIEAVNGRFAESLRPYRRGADLELAANGLFPVGAMLARCGRHEEAREVFERAQTGHSNAALQQLALCYQRALDADRDGMIQAVTPALAAAAQGTDYLSWELACAYAMVGQLSEANDWLETTIRLGFINHPFLSGIDPHLANLHGDPRFERTMARVKNEWEAFVA